MRGLLITLGCIVAYVLTGLMAARGLRLFELHNPKHRGRDCDDGNCCPMSVVLAGGPIALAILLLILICTGYAAIGRWVYYRPTWTDKRELRRERREKEARRWATIAADLERRFPITSKLCDHGENGCTPDCLLSMNVRG